MDGLALQRFARQMKNCELTLNKMGWSEDLNNGETLLRTVDRLPQYMQLKWAEKAGSILKLGRRPQCRDLTKFVQDKADVATNMFGKHIVESRRKSIKDSFKLANLIMKGLELQHWLPQGMSHYQETRRQLRSEACCVHMVTISTSAKSLRRRLTKNVYKLFARIKSAIIVLNRDTLQEGASKESIVNCQNVVGNTTLCYILRSLTEKIQCKRTNQYKLTRNHHVTVMWLAQNVVTCIYELFQ